MIIYAPIFPVYLYYNVKTGTPFFIVAANPSMENGGYMMESKYTIYQQLPAKLVPKTIKILPGEKFAMVLDHIFLKGIKFPCYCKPDVGCKGIGVAKIENEIQMQQYHESCRSAYLVQDQIPFDKEIGIFYCRIPGEPMGKITAIVGKKNMQVTGNGKSTLIELIESVPRYYFQRRFLRQKYKDQLNDILPEGKNMILSEVGNHSRGSEFEDLTKFNNRRLEKIFDEISKEYNTLYFGRYDIKFNTWEDLYQGKNFMLIELNGSGSEPTNIYDPKKSLFHAWKIILKHWKLLFLISSHNHRLGTPYFSFKEGRKLQIQEKRIKRFFNDPNAVF